MLSVPAAKSGFKRKIILSGKCPVCKKKFKVTLENDDPEYSCPCGGFCYHGINDSVVFEDGIKPKDKTVRKAIKKAEKEEERRATARFLWECRE